ncbi:MAG: hypothetical protein HQL56_05625 [Magnetococcales bacterium]|nr:hypothetical protein [Magnetococcales bacterium]
MAWQTDESIWRSADPVDLESGLSRGAQQVSRIIGVKSVIALAKHYIDGKRLYVPEEIALSHPLVRIIGLGAALSLSRVYGGSDIRIPKLHNALRGARDAAIRKAVAEGKKITDVGRRFGVTRRYAYKILEGGRMDQGGARQ